MRIKQAKNGLQSRSGCHWLLWTVKDDFPGWMSWMTDEISDIRYNSYLRSEGFCFMMGRWMDSRIAFVTWLKTFIQSSMKSCCCWWVAVHFDWLKPGSGPKLDIIVRSTFSRNLLLLLQSIFPKNSGKNGKDGSYLQNWYQKLWGVRVKQKMFCLQIWQVSWNRNESWSLAGISFYCSHGWLKNSSKLGFHNINNNNNFKFNIYSLIHNMIIFNFLLKSNKRTTSL